MLHLHEGDQPRRIPYTPALFVAREDTTRVLEAVREVRRNASAKALVFRGARGSGKTWFALDLHCCTLREKFADGVSSFYISLEVTDDQPRAERCNSRIFYLFNDSDPDDWPLDWRLQRLLLHIYPHLAVTTASTASLRELDEWASRRFNAPAYQNTRLTRVFFIDGAFEVDRELLRLLERHLLSHLLTLPCTLIVIMGRGRKYQWRNGLLRQSDSLYELSPFSIDEIHTQIHHLNLNGLARDSLEQLRVYGGGIPLSTSVLARFGVSVKTLDALVDLLLGKRNTTLRPYFETLAPLDGFMEEEIEYLLLDNEPLSGRERWHKAREIRQQLVNTQLVTWDQTDGVWRMDEALRCPLERWVYEASLNRWMQIHRKMRSYYLNWAKESDEYRAYFEARAGYHTVQLDHMDG